MAKAEPSKELVVAGEDSPFAVLRMDSSELRELIQDNLGGDTLSARDLDRVKVPAGGGTTWEVPTLEGEESTKTLSGVIVARATRRAYWPTKFDGSDDPPDCASEDGIVGVGEPGGSCAECPFNEFQSAQDGISKACKETRQLFMLTEDSLIPIVVTIPPGSLANTKAYMMRLLRNQLKVTDLVTELSLQKAQSKGGIEYSQVVFTGGSRLDASASAAIRSYAAILEPAFQRAARVDRSEVDSAA